MIKQFQQEDHFVDVINNDKLSIISVLGNYLIGNIYNIGIIYLVYISLFWFTAIKKIRVFLIPFLERKSVLKIRF